MERSIPLWAWGVLAFLALGTVRAWLPEPVSDEVRARARELRVERDPRHMSVRELRQLPGVGHKLALVLAHTRDAHVLAQPLAWEDVPGIGAVRAREIRAWCRARGIDPDPLCVERRARAGRGYPVGVDIGVDIGMDKSSFLTRLLLLAFLAACRDTTSAGSVPLVPDPHAAALAAARPPRTLALQGGALHALEAGRVEGPLVLLLHGARFSAHTWEELGTLALLARAGYHALAIDWPGYGATPDWGAAVDASVLISSVCDELGAQRVVLVAPSLSGRFAFEFLRTSAARVAALVAIAPAGAEGFDPEAWATPTLLVWGEHDEVVPLAQGRALAGRLAGARLEILPGASHPCYLDQPERFHALLLEFLSSVAFESVERGR